MTDHEIRLMLLDADNVEQIKKLMPTKADREVFKALLVFESMTSSEYSAWAGISVHHASQLLKNCFDRGYLVRAKIVAKSGGDEFVYVGRY